MSKVTCPEPGVQMTQQSESTPISRDIPTWRERLPDTCTYPEMTVAMQAQIDDLQAALAAETEARLANDKALNAFMKRMVHCENCEGSGLLSNHVTGDVECSSCEGTGWSNAMVLQLAETTDELTDVKRELATIENETIERCVQLCLLERDKADKREPDPPGSSMNLDHIVGQGWMANLLAKKLLAMKTEG